MNDLPDLPPIQTGPAIWYGPNMAQRQDEWLTHLTRCEINEIEAAASPLISPDFNIGTMIRDDFKLPTLSKKLSEIRNELLNGRGFVLLRGLPVASYTERQAATIFYGLGTHLARPALKTPRDMYWVMSAT